MRLSHKQAKHVKNWKRLPISMQNMLRAERHYHISKQNMCRAERDYQRSMQTC